MFLNKRIAKLMALGLAISVALPALAQDQQSTDAAESDAGRQGRAQMFSRLDTNADGAINFQEFSAMPLPSFDQQDTNGDGSVSRDEIMEQRFTRMDTDGNGLLSPEELRGPGREVRRGEGERRQGEMRERMRDMTPEQRAQMRERMQNMTPEQREAMRAQMRQNAQAGNAAQNGSGNAPALDH